VANLITGVPVADPSFFNGSPAPPKQPRHLPEVEVAADTFCHQSATICHLP
jgi:hypothetical protein